MTEWISVKDRLPQKDDKVLLLFDGAIYVGGLESGNNFFLCDTLGLLSTKNVTHWMSLPELPKSKGPFYVSESCGCLGIKHENGQGFYFSSARKVDIEAVVSWINHIVS